MLLKSAATEIRHAPAHSTGPSKMGGRPATEAEALPLHSLKLDPRVIPNRAHALLYTCAIVALLYRHSLRLLHSPTFSSSFLFLAMLLSDIILAFMWATTQSFRWRPVHRQTFPENLASVVGEEDFPGLDVFICTADPYKEPPMSVVNTALSAMAFDYPSGKMSVYVSDDGGSELTLFAFMEAARFARHWMPFCRENKIEDRCPEVYFKAGGASPALKKMYQDMKERVEGVVERGRVSNDEIRSEDEANAFKKWTGKFTRQDHPTVIQVLVESEKDVDVNGTKMPNLVYVSREKRKSTPHNFKAGALNVLLRVSGVFSNAPVILTLDCDMYSNDPQTPRRALCHLLDPTGDCHSSASLAFVQFPQRYRGLNKNDIYASEHKHLFQINAVGMDGLAGPNYVGTGCFFRRRAFFGPPSSPHSDFVGEPSAANSFRSQIATDAAHRAASSTFEERTEWGDKVGFRYGSLVEDYFTGYRLACEGWKSVFCNPQRAAFLGDVPINLEEALSQNRRWSIGLLQVAFSDYNPLTFGIKRTSLAMGLSYAHYAYWPILAIPITTYAVLPPAALLNHISLFPTVSDPWLYLHAYLFVGAYGQDLVDFLMAKGTIQRWWSDQRMWMLRGLSSYLFALTQFSFKLLGISGFGFGFQVTSKLIDDEQSSKYERGIFEFGVSSLLFVPIATAAVINLASFTVGITRALREAGKGGEMFGELFISGFVVLNGWPIYEAMILRSDKGRMPAGTTVISLFLAFFFFLLASLVLKN